MVAVYSILDRKFEYTVYTFSLLYDFSLTSLFEFCQQQEYSQQSNRQAFAGAGEHIVKVKYKNGLKIILEVMIHDKHSDRY